MLPTTYTKKETAIYLGVCQKTIDRLVEKGKINSYKIGRYRKFSESQINEYLKSVEAW